MGLVRINVLLKLTLELAKKQTQSNGINILCDSGTE